MRIKHLFAALLFVAASVAGAHAATEVRMAGDTRVYGVFFANRNFTGWDETGTRTEDRMTI